MLCGTVLSAGNNRTHKIAPYPCGLFLLCLTSKHNNITGTIRNIYICIYVCTEGEHSGITKGAVIIST